MTPPLHRLEVEEAGVRRIRVRLTTRIAPPEQRAFWLRALWDADPHLLSAAGIHPDWRFDAVFVERHAARFVERVSLRPLAERGDELDVAAEIELGPGAWGEALPVGRSWTSSAHESREPAAPAVSPVDLGWEHDRWLPFPGDPHRVLAALRYSPDGRFLACLSERHHLAVLSTETARESTRVDERVAWSAEIFAHPSRPLAICVDGEEDDAGDNRRLRAFDLETGEPAPLEPPHAHVGWVDERPERVDLVDGRPLLGPSDLLAARYSDTRSFLIVRDEWSAQLVVLRDGDPWQAVDGFAVLLFSAAFLPDDRLAYVEGDALRVRDLRRGTDRTLVRDARLSKSATHGLDASPDGRWLAFADGSGLGLVDVAEARIVQYVRPPRGSVAAPVFRPDGRELAAIVGAEVVRYELGAEVDHGRAPPRGYAALGEPVPLLLDVESYESVPVPEALRDTWSRARALANGGMLPSLVNRENVGPNPPCDHPVFVELVALVEQAWRAAPDVVERRWLPLLLERIPRWAAIVPWRFSCDAVTWEPRPVDYLALPPSADARAIPPATTSTRLLSARCPALGLARLLELASSPIDLEALAWLTTQLDAPHLEGLDLTHTQLPREAGSWLARASFRPRLRYLGLGSNHLGDEAIEALLAVPWPELRMLDLGDNRLGLRSVEALVADRLPMLTSLSLNHNRIGDRGVARFSVSACGLGSRTSPSATPASRTRA